MTNFEKYKSILEVNGAQDWVCIAYHIRNNKANCDKNCFRCGLSNIIWLFKEYKEGE